MVVYFIILFPTTRIVDMLYTRVAASGPLMNFDWSVVWTHAGDLAQGTELTVLLAVVTMAIAVPGGIMLALLRLSGSRVLAGPAPASPSSSATCR